MVRDAEGAEPPAPDDARRRFRLDIRHGRDDGFPTRPGRQRYLRRAAVVRWLRYVLPALAVLILVVSLFWSEIVPRGNRLGIEAQPPQEAPAAPSTESVVNATYSGVDKLGRPFSVTAEHVSSPEGESGVLRLGRPSGQITLTDGSQVTLEARDGSYDRARDTLVLRGDVTLRHNDLTARSASATIDTKTSSASGDEPVDGSGSFGTITGQGFRVGDDGNTVLVTGPARMLIVPGAKPMLR